LLFLLLLRLPLLLHLVLPFLGLFVLALRYLLF
jgi:hypothetical protein